MEELLLGTYTNETSKGIYRIILDTHTKSLINLEPIINEKQPTYLALDHQHHLFSVSKYDNKGGIAVFEERDATYTLLNRVLQQEAPLCHITIDTKHQLVFGANYHSGAIHSYLIEDNGNLSLSDSVYRHGDGPHPNQQHSHIHFTGLTPDQRLIACDLGTDDILLYDVSLTGQLTEIACCHLPDGTGPRHLVFHPSLPIIYVIGELDSYIHILDYDPLSSSLTRRHTSYSLINGLPAREGAAAIRISHDGRFLYASNRANHSLHVFEVTANGNLTHIQALSTEGQGPRDFNFNRTEEFLIVGNQLSNNLTLFTRNAQTGKLTLCQKDIYAPEVVCVLSSEN